MKKALKTSVVVMLLITLMFIIKVNNVSAAATCKIYFKVGEQTYVKDVDSSTEQLVMPTEKELKENGISLAGKTLTGWKHTGGTGRIYGPGKNRGGGVSDGLTLEAVLEDITYSIETKTICNDEGPTGKVEVKSNGTTVTKTKYGQNLKILLTLPGEGYEVTELKVAGKSIFDGANKTEYNITAPEGDSKNQIMVEATYAKKEFDVTVNSDVQNGNISADKDVVKYNDSCTITLTPDTNYEVDYLKLNGSEVTVDGNTYTKTNVKEDLNFEVAFKKKIFKIELNTEVEHGSISVDSDEVEYNGSCTITLTPDEGYELDYLKIDGNPVEVTGNTYTISPVTSEHSIEVAYKIKKFEIKSSVISGEGNITVIPSVVNYGEDCTVMLVPAIGYRVDYLEINGIRSYGIEGNMYVIENIKQAYDIKVAYAKLPFVITIKSVEGATIDPSRSLIVFYNDSQTFTIKANEGYRLVSVKVNGEEQSLPLENDKLVLTNITEHKTVDVVVEKIKFQVTTNVKGGNGEITSGKVVEYGDNFIIDFTPAEGYMIDTLTINGEDIEIAENVYRIENIKEDYDVEVSYTKIPFTLKIEDADNATISPVGSLVVYYGDNQVINIKAIRGYKLVSVTVNGKEQELPLTDDSLELKGITEDTVVIAKIEKETYYVVEGKDQTYNNDGELVVKFNGDLDLFVKLLINGEELDASKYTTESGSTVVKLSQAYLDSLPDGTYTMTAVYSNGNTAETTFTIARNNSNNPTTGDAIALSIAILAVSLAGIIITVKKFKKAK